MSLLEIHPIFLSEIFLIASRKGKISSMLNDFEKKIKLSCFYCGERWEASVRNRLEGKNDCPTCVQRRIEARTSCFATIHKEMMKYWSFEDNMLNGIDPYVVCPKGDLMITWKCDASCGHHKWKQILKNQKRVTIFCPFCRTSGTRMFCECTSFWTVRKDIRHELDFKKLKEMKINPKTMPPRCGDLIPWICRKHTTCDEHHWEETPHNRGRYLGKEDKHGGVSGDNCPFCSKHHTCTCDSIAVLCEEEMRFWDYKKNNKLGLDPYHIRPGSEDEAFFICPDHKGCNSHQWFEKIEFVMKRGWKCKFCSNHKACPCTSLVRWFPDIAMQFDVEKNREMNETATKKIVLTELSRFSHFKVWWLGKCGHSWKSRVQERTKNGTGCPQCRESKLEKECRRILNEKKDEYGFEFTTQKTFDELRGKRNRHLRFDICIIGYWTDVLIELDGLQHFEDVKFDGKTSNLKTIQEYDKKKLEFTLGSSRPFLRISYSEMDSMEDHLVEFLDKVVEQYSNNDHSSLIMFRGIEYESLYNAVIDD